MKSLIILKGLAKSEKLKWVEKEGLGNYFLDIDVFRKIYSSPELVKPGLETLSRSFGSLVHERFMEALIIRLGKGCLIVVDLDEDPVVTVETLAMIHGYTVFYHIQPIPQDYCNKPKKYNLPWQSSKKKEELDIDVKNFMNLQLSDKLVINNYQDLIDYWNEHEVVINIKKKTDLIHISDIHSNWSLWKDITKGINSDSIIIHHGDYIDGLEEGGSKKLMQEIIKDRKDSGRYWLEGNHELRLRRFLGWKILNSQGSKIVPTLLYKMLPEGFLTTTALEFDSLPVKECKRWLQELNQKLKTHIVVCRGKDSYVCTHAGLKMIEQISPKHVGIVVYGNRDMDRYDKEFSYRNKETGILSIHAHCKYPSGWNTAKYDSVVNIDPEDESKVVVFNNSYNKNNWTFKVWQKSKSPQE